MYNLPITLIYCSASLGINDEFIFSAFRCCRGNCKQLGHSMGNPLMLFSCEYKSSYFQMRFHQSAFLQNSEFKNSAEHCCIDNSVTTNFFFSVCISSFSSLILHCCCSAERIWNIYQGTVCWRHNFYMVMLLAFEITVCNGEQNNLSVEQVLCFQETQRHKYGFLLTFAERWIRFLWLHSFTSNWFKFGL